MRGEWRPAEILPSEVQLAAEYGVSQGTVRKALDDMEAENLIVRRQGRGTFVASHGPHRALFHFFHLVRKDGVRELPTSRVISVRRERAGREEAGRLALPSGSRVVRILRVRELQGRPSIVERISAPEALFPGLGRPPSDLPNTLYELYERRYGVTIVRAVERLRAVAADAEEARLLGLKPGAPLLEIDRVALGLDNRPVEWRVSRCDTGRHHYLSEIT